LELEKNNQKNRKNADTCTSDISTKKPYMYTSTYNKKSKLLSDDRRTIFQITNFGTTISTRTSIRRKKNKKCTFRIKKSTIRKKT